MRKKCEKKLGTSLCIDLLLLSRKYMWYIIMNINKHGYISCSCDDGYLSNVKHFYYASNLFQYYQISCCSFSSFSCQQTINIITSMTDKYTRKSKMPKTNLSRVSACVIIYSHA